MRYPAFAPYALIFVIAVIVGIRTFSASDTSPNSRTQPLAYGGQITIVLSVVLVLMFLGPYLAAGKLISILVLVLFAAVYYSLLYIAIPHLRSKISAVGCSYLWLIPSILSINELVIMSDNKPLLWIDLGRTTSRILLAVSALYLAAATGIFISKIVAHLRYRKRIMDPARTLAGTPAYPILEEEAEKIGSFEDYVPNLLVSPEVSAPVSIGFFKKSRAILLPPEEFTPDELRIILRHELIHIARNDCEAKLDLVLVTSILWPVPFIRKTSMRCAEDLELSCDELVLRGYSEEDRQAYAKLILSRSAESEGFSSCLSASAESLKYRLSHVMDPVQKHSGALLVCIVLLASMLLFRAVGVSVYAGSGRDLIFEKFYLAPTAKLGMVYMKESNSSYFASVTDQEKFNEYIAGLDLNIASWDDPAQPLQDDLQLIYYQDSERSIDLHIAGDRIYVFGPGPFMRGAYKVPEGIDWEYLRSMITPRN